MKRSDLKFSKVDSFLSEYEYHLLIDCFFNNYKVNEGSIIDKDGNITEDISLGKGRIRSYTHDIEVWKKLLPEPAVNVIYKMREQVKLQGLENPQPREYTFFYNPESMGWHRDVNLEGHPDKLRYVTFLTLSEKNLNQKIRFMVSPNKDGPGLWKIGIDEWIPANTFISHVQLMGHEYQRNTDNLPMHVFSIQWYDIKP